MENIIFNFIKQHREEKVYQKVRKILIKKGYKPLNNITYTYSFDCKQTKRPYYPYSIIIKYKYNYPPTNYRLSA